MVSFRQGSEAQAILTRDKERLLPVYTRYPVVIEYGSGVELFDTDGHRYLDLMAGLGVNALGHAHPRLVKALTEQAGRLVHLSPVYSSRYPSMLAERLCEMAGMAGAFFSTGGSESVEGALKLARSYGKRSSTEGKFEIVALNQGYHGRTFGSLSVTGQEKYRLAFEPGLPGVRFVERNDRAQLRAAVSDQTCAILIEPIQGEGGVLECNALFLEEARRLADAHDALLIFDEIQCGLGRTGEWFAFGRAGVRPDILILGKPLGGGLPLSALLVTGSLLDALELGKHGSTLGGSPLACRLGLEFLDVMAEEGLLAQATRVGAYLKRRLEDIASRHMIVRERRGRGLIQALDLCAPARPIVEAALAEGVMLNSVQGNVLRFLPPLILKEVHVDEAMDLLDQILKKHAPLEIAEESMVGAGV